MTIQWVALDWGTTNLSAYAIGDDGEILDEIHSSKGMSQLVSSEFEPTLLEEIGHWLPEDQIIPIVACGMVGASEGWLEAAYSEVPCHPVDAGSAIVVPTQDPRLSVRIVPGVCQRQPDDVMRGEETQIAGYISQNPNFDGLFCLPGTHSKWVKVAGGEIRAFTTFMTGELFSLLTKHSVLRFSTNSLAWDNEAFLSGVETAMLDASRLTALIFGPRPATLLSGTPNSTLKAHLSGLLIGAEIAAVREIWSGQDVVIIGDCKNAGRYQDALEISGSSPCVYDASKAIIDGLRSLAILAPHTAESCGAEFRHSLKRSS